MPQTIFAMAAILSLFQIAPLSDTQVVTMLQPQPSNDTETVQWYASGWPIALAEAACDGDEGCLTKLANCGPGESQCTWGVSQCDYTRKGTVIFSTVCQTDRDPIAGGIKITADIPGHANMTAVIGGEDVTQLNGMRAIVTDAHCVKTRSGDELFCVRPIVDRAEMETWIEEST